MILRLLINCVLNSGKWDILYKTIYLSYYLNKDEIVDMGMVHSSYGAAMGELLELPDKQTDYKLVVEKVEDGHAVKLVERDETYALDHVSWEDLIGATILDETKQLLKHEILAHILWEITFYGFTLERVNQQREEFQQTVDEVDRGEGLEEFKLEDL